MTRQAQRLGRLLALGVSLAGCVREAGPAPCTTEGLCLDGHRCVLGFCERCPDGSCEVISKKVVGPGGGPFCGVDGVCIDVPPGALASPTELTIRRPEAQPNWATPRLVSKIYELGPATVEFLSPATVRIPVAGSPMLEQVAVFRSRNGTQSQLPQGIQDRGAAGMATDLGGEFAAGLYPPTAADAGFPDASPGLDALPSTDALPTMDALNDDEGGADVGFLDAGLPDSGTPDVGASDTGTLDGGRMSSAGPGPNEPSGMTARMNEGWSTVPSATYAGDNSLSWWCDGSDQGAAYSILLDPTAPLSPGDVLRLTYQGNIGGGSPTHSYYAYPSGLMSNEGTMYVRLGLRVSANWTDAGNVGTKLFFPRANAANENSYVGLTIEGDFRLHWSENGAGWNSHDYYATDVLAKGVWHDVEILLFQGTTSTARDGYVKIWVDGSLRLEQFGLQMMPGGAVGYGYIFYDPTFGGGLNNPPAPQFLDIDHWYVSVR